MNVFFEMRKFSFHVRFAFACSTIFFLIYKHIKFTLSYSEMIKRLSVDYLPIGWACDYYYKVCVFL